MLNQKPKTIDMDDENPPLPRDTKEVAVIITELYSSSFGGKSKQSYLIDLDFICHLFSSTSLKNDLHLKLKHECFLLGFYLFETFNKRGDTLIAVTKVSSVNRWRKLPQKMKTNYQQKKTEQTKMGNSEKTNVGWQPIETVPKDGTMVDLWDLKTQTRVTDCVFEQDRHTPWRRPNQTARVNGAIVYYTGTPTHWSLPLGSPNTEEEIVK
jgi:hypothetical protein